MKGNALIILVKAETFSQGRDIAAGRVTVIKAHSAVNPSRLEREERARADCLTVLAFWPSQLASTEDARKRRHYAESHSSSRLTALVMLPR